MSLQDCKLLFEYRSDQTNLVDQLYIPCFNESTRYFRAVGYFTSRGLALAAKGLTSFINRGGKMRLIASPLFEAEDMIAFNKGYDERGKIIERAILRQFDLKTIAQEPALIRDRLSYLAWLIAEERLDIKVAILTQFEAEIHEGIYHEKVGIFLDAEDNIVAFTGSPNETVGGIVNNFEAVDVFVSWDDNHGRAKHKLNNYELLWNNKTPKLRVIDFPTAARERIVSLRPKKKPINDPESGFNPNALNIEWGNPTEQVYLTTHPMEGKAMYKVFLEKHVEIISNYKDPKGYLIVYKGFPLSFLKDIGNKYAFLDASAIVESDDKIDLRHILDNARESIKKLLNIKDEVVICTYEELQVISDNIHLSFLDRQIVIFNNNLFNQYPNQSYVTFPNIDQAVEKGDLNYEENKLLNHFYAYSDESFGITLLQNKDIDVSEYPNVTNINFFDEKAFDLTSIKYDPLKSEKVPEDAIPANEFDKSYFFLKYALFGIGSIQTKDITIVTDLISLRTNNLLKFELEVLRQIYELNGFKISINLKSSKPQTESRPEYKSILKKYWKSDSFREMLFYEDPGRTRNTIAINQDCLIDEIVQQVEKATNNEHFGDIFITAPTGSGKSLLFQVPAIYLHEQKELITIIVSPLISLMYDQISALKKMGVSFAECINSDITIVERDRIIESIKSGKTSILYLSPELLLSYDIRHFIGNERAIGLLVIDEAHLVTTWGRDFRVDYWYLGSYIKRLRKYMGTTSKFPMVALTATAVYQGSDDIVFATIESLNMRAPLLHIGNVRRDNVKFDIRHFQIKHTHEDEKINKTKEILLNNIDTKTKTIAYFPWVRQIQQVMDVMPVSHKPSIDVYHGRILGTIKQIAMDNFQNGSTTVVLATKAFGMGIDVDDIQQIYHHAPSGNLSDYIQEVGRVARKKDLTGVAATDFNLKDLKFTKILYGLSSLKQYQVRFVLQKIYDLYKAKRENQMLVSTEDFEFIFPLSNQGKREDIERKVKSALLCIEKDLFRKMNNQYNVLIVRPKSMFAKVFACVNDEISTEYLSKYGDCCRLIMKKEDNARSRSGRQQTSICDMGDIYEIQLDKVWQRYFGEESFPRVKHLFYKQRLFTEFGEQSPSPRYQLDIILNDDPGETISGIERCFNLLTDIFNKFGGNSFKDSDLLKVLKEGFGSEVLARRITNLITNLYSGYFFRSNKGSSNLPVGTFLYQKSNDKGEKTYRVISNSYIAERDYVLRNFKKLFNNNAREYKKFIRPGALEGEIAIKIAYLVESLLLGHYQLFGGSLSQIFIRIIDTYKLKTFAEDPHYSNSILSDVDSRHKSSIEQMENFFTSEMNDVDRWNYIEDYFLGSSERIV